MSKKKSKRNDGKNVKMENLKIVDKCNGCDKVKENETCERFYDPSFHWEDDQICAFASHIKREVKKEKKKVNPLKASKRAGRR